MTYCDISGDHEHDLDSLVLIMGHFNDAYLDYDLEPHLDEVAEMSSWTRTLMAFGSAMEEEYGASATKQMFGRAWKLARE